MIRCAICDRPVKRGETSCPRCGAVETKEQLVIPESGKPMEEWEVLPARARLSWDEMPSVGTIYKLFKSGGFTLSRENLLAQVRASVPLPTKPMSYGEVREWLIEHADLLADANWSVEVFREDLGWTEAPAQPRDSG